MDKQKWKRRGIEALKYIGIGAAIILIDPAHDPDHVDSEIRMMGAEKQNKIIQIQETPRSYDTSLIKIMDDAILNPNHAKYSKDSTQVYITRLVRKDEGNGIVSLTIPNLDSYKVQQYIKNKTKHPSLDTIISLQHHHISGKFMGELDDTVRNEKIKPENKEELEKFTKIFYNNK